MQKFLKIFLFFAFILLFLQPQNLFAADGPGIYKERCNRCHGPNGDGKGEIGKFMNPGPANYKVRLKTISEAQIKQSIIKGKGGMPSFKNTLSEQEIDSVISYIKTLAR